MGNLLTSLPKTIHASLGLAVILFLGLFFGGSSGGPSNYNTIDYITIGSAGDAVDYGDLTYDANRHGCGTSNGHGGL